MKTCPECKELNIDGAVQCCCGRAFSNGIHARPVREAYAGHMPLSGAGQATKQASSSAVVARRKHILLMIAIFVFLTLGALIVAFIGVCISAFIPIFGWMIGIPIMIGALLNIPIFAASLIAEYRRL